jgi:hypothetical protein
MLLRVITRKEAKSQGFKHYFTGKVCSNGHLDKRLITNSGCMACRKANNLKHYPKNKEKISKRHKNYRKVNKEILLEREEKYRKTHKLQIKESNRKYNSKNKVIRAKKLKEYNVKNAEKIKLIQLNYRKSNIDKVKFWASNYRARKRKSLPLWANLDNIKEFYKNCPNGYEVDHVVPLKGFNREGVHVVCGLHVENNLQYLTPQENRSKNKYYD